LLIALEEKNKVVQVRGRKMEGENKSNMVSGKACTKFFQNHAKHMKNVNIIQQMRKEDGIKVKRFQNIAKLWLAHFKKLYQASHPT
jgi:hypothetical protein